MIIINGICYIVGASVFFGSITPNEDDFVIAADGGYKALKKINIVPDLILGDFDSVDIPESPNVKTFPKEKNDTDTLIAVKEGLSRGYKTFRIFGGTGGRTDHTIANIQCLSYIANNGGAGFLEGDDEFFTVIKNSSLKIDSDELKTFSIFALGGKAEGVFIKNAKYELNNASLTTDFPVGVSNEFLGEIVTISVNDGSLLIFWQNGD